MPLDFGRAPGVAEVSIDKDKCSVCGLCVRVCRGAPLYMEAGEVRVDHSRLFGCIGCGHCAAICPNGCIAVTGRDLAPDDLMECPSVDTQADYGRLKALMLHRRSVRDFQDREVERSVIDQILEAASTAPMGVPPSEVGVLVMDGRAKVQQMKADLAGAVESAKWMLSPAMLALMRPMLGKEGYNAMKAFVAPVADVYTGGLGDGRDWFFYDAPLAMFFYGSQSADPVDPTIAATYAMLAAESLGLGSCMLGFPAYILKYSKKLKAKYGLEPKMQPGVMLIMGYPALNYQRAIKRRFAEVRFV